MNRSILRGTIYDRNMEEMSVSYQLFSLFVHPAELTDRESLAEQLAIILADDKKIILRHLQSIESIVRIADDLEARQVVELEKLRQPGIYCTPIEVRYYPSHAWAGHLLGFINDKTGLSGVEALYDPILQPGEFRRSNVPSVNFSGYEALGKTSTDVVLTVDMELQKRLEQMLADYRKQKGAVSGSLTALDLNTGRVLAMVSQPSFDPNYFWQVDEQKENNAVFAPQFVPELIRPLLVKAAAIHEAGIEGHVLPLTLSIPDYGLTGEQLSKHLKKFGLERPVPYFLPVSLEQAVSTIKNIGKSDRLSNAQIAVGVASLLNSGYRVTPWFLNALYDHAEKHFFMRDSAANVRERILAPANGIKLRRELLLNSRYSTKDGFLFVNSSSTVSEYKEMSVYHLQDVLLAAVPTKMPSVLLTFSVDYGVLYPQPPGVDSGLDNERLANVGHHLLSILTDYAKSETTVMEPPKKKSAVNMSRYLFSRRLTTPDLQKKYEHVQPTMPQLIGLSLRKGLQQVNQYNLKVRIRGSGRIVSQKPAVGEPLSETETCELILETSI